MEFPHIKRKTEALLRERLKGIPRMVSSEYYQNALGDGRLKVKTSTGPAVGPGTYYFPQILSPSF